MQRALIARIFQHEHTVIQQAPKEDENERRNKRDDESLHRLGILTRHGRTGLIDRANDCAGNAEHD